jgi:hypothetical protein
LWDIQLQRRHEFCERFVREYHPGMADVRRIKGARPLVPLDGPGCDVLMCSLRARGKRRRQRRT